MMRKLLAFLFAVILSTPSLAADNTVILTPGSGVTMRTQDVGSGVQSPYNILGNLTGGSIYGAQGTPNAAYLSVQGSGTAGAIPVTLTSTTITGTVTLAAAATTVIGTVRNLGNLGAVFDAATGAAVPANALQIGFSDGTNLIAGRVGAVANVAAATGMQQVLGVSQYNATPLTVTDTRYQSLQSDVNGFLKVNVAAGGASGGTSSNFGSAFPTPGTAAGFSDGTNMVAAKVGAIANVTAATNMVNVLGAAQYNATPLTVTDTRYQSLQSDVNGFLKVNVTNATTAVANNADAVAVSTGGNSPVANYGYVYNGTTWDRMAGTAAAGVRVLQYQGSTVLSATNGTYANLLQGNVALTTANPLPTANNPYPVGATPYTATATGTTGATTATLAASGGATTTYICGFSIRANATAAATGNATVTGVITATLNFTQWTAPNASGLGITEMIFAPCVPASASNTAIAVVSAAPGTGGVVSVTAWGYKL